MSVLIAKNSLVLFQGDSITDAGRNRADPNGLGNGYAMLAAALFQALHPERNVRFLNRGISGNRAKDLRNRWTEDCIDLRPDWVSIMIGINDTWRRFDSNDPTSVEAYETALRAILERTRDEIGARLVLVEPFVLPHPEDRKAWRGDLDGRIGAVHRLAKEFGAVLVPMDRIFADNCRDVEPRFWAEDGVHPSMPGHGLIAYSWMKAVGAL